KFTRYFSYVLQNHGTPDINPEEYSRMLNIIVLENKIDLLEQIQKRVRHADRKHYLSADITQLRNKLNRLTMENKPENLLKYMLKESRYNN
ncbi:MAG: hypothetical protein AAF688_01730, partial [Bacteroidota bacterium]